ncbi:MAG: HAD-IIIA family hydrolase [Clostridiales bacterium]|nr:HAD-IIIA family hydrolase [Clostridiales bacterium]
MKFERVTDIFPEDIKRLGAKTVFLDLDNTCVCYGSNYVDPDIREWVSRLKESGLKVAVLSNTIPVRGHIVASKLGSLPCFCLACKPLPFMALLAAKILRTSPEEIVMIGDKLTADILCANIIGAYSIKVDKLAGVILRQQEERLRVAAQ